jgi:hypothetical protein
MTCGHALTLHVNGQGSGAEAQADVEISLAKGEAPRAAERVNEYQAQAADCGTTG